MTSLVACLLASISASSEECMDDLQMIDYSEMEEIECTISPIDRSRIHPKGSAAVTASGQTVSSNWSGYVAAPTFQQSATGSVTYAAGCWTVPTLSATPDNSYCAIWIGIDGFLDGSVEQIGTSHNWVQGVQQNYAWFEMYPQGAFEIIGFPVDNGDVISARVGYKGNDTFKLVIFNHTKGVSTVIPAWYTTSPGTSRSSAEWIVEAPYSGSILPLSDFQLTTLNYCSAIINGVQGTIGEWVNDAITMEGWCGVKALPSALLKNGSAFSVAWESE